MIFQTDPTAGIISTMAPTSAASAEISSLCKIFDAKEKPEIVSEIQRTTKETSSFLPPEVLSSWISDSKIEEVRNSHIVLKYL